MNFRRLAPDHYREDDLQFGTRAHRRGKLVEADCSQAWLLIEPPLIVRNTIVDCKPILVSVLYRGDEVFRFTVDKEHQGAAHRVACRSCPALPISEFRSVVEAAALQDLSERFRRAMRMS